MLYPKMISAYYTFLIKKIYLLLFILLISNSICSSKPSFCHKCHKKNKGIIENNLPYTVVQDSTINNSSLQIHADTIFTKKYALKKIMTTYQLIPDTTIQNANVYSINYDTIFHYDYVPVNPAFTYTGKIKMIKPFKFFCPSEVLNKPRVALVAGLEGGLYAVANVWWSNAWYSKYGRNPIAAFHQIRALVVRTAEASQSGKFEKEVCRTA